MIAGVVGADVRAVLRAGRAVTGEHQLRVAGTAALIGMAQTRGLISCARNVFEARSQSDFRISAELIRTVLARTKSRQELRL